MFVCRCAFGAEREKRVEVEFIFYFSPLSPPLSLRSLLLVLSEASILPPRGALSPRINMRSAVSIGRAAAMPSCSRRVASSAPSAARRVAVKVNFESKVVVVSLSLSLFERSTDDLPCSPGRAAPALRSSSTPAHRGRRNLSTMGPALQIHGQSSPRGGGKDGNQTLLASFAPFDLRSPGKKKLSLLPHQPQAGGMEQVGSAYAAALVETAQAKGSLDAVHADVDTLQVRKKENNFRRCRCRRRREFLLGVAGPQKKGVASSFRLFCLFLPLFSWCTSNRDGRADALSRWQNWKSKRGEACADSNPS